MQDHIGFGLNETLMAQLSTVSGLSPMMSINNNPICSKLGWLNLLPMQDSEGISQAKIFDADWIITGQYQLSDGSIRITTELIDPKSGMRKKLGSIQGDYSKIAGSQLDLFKAILRGIDQPADDGIFSSAAEAGTRDGTAFDYFSQGMEKIDSGNCAMALGLLNKSLSHDKNYTLALTARGVAHSCLQKEQEAEADFASALDTGRNKSLVLVSRATVRLFGSHPELALEDYNSAIALRQNDPLLLVGRGAIKIMTGDIDAAIADYDTAIDLRPNSPFVLFGRGFSHYRKRAMRKAIKDLEKAISAAPIFSAPYANLGSIYFKLGEKDKALTNYNKAISLSPNSGELFNNRGAVHYAAEDPYGAKTYDTAFADFNRAIELDPDRPHAFHGRGLVYFNRRKYDLAIADYGRAIELEPDFGDAFFNRAVAYRAKGMPSNERKDLQKACDLGARKGCQELARLK